MEDEEFVLHLPLSEYGRITEQGILNIPQCYPSVTVEKYCIMPNHIHMILSFSRDCGRIISAPTLSRVVGQMKRWVSKQIGVGIWQKSYYERVIRNGTEYEEIWRYIQENPLKYLLKEETT
ncbi:MAG: transposase [Firmicutes bacterium]|nr:transposase [Bacillota bacterium]